MAEWVFYFGVCKMAFDAVAGLQLFDVQEPEDLYKLFFFCHLFSWLVVMWKLRN